MLTHAISPLPDAVEDVIHKVIGCALSVHTALGAGYVEPVYQKAMTIELRHQGLSCATEHVVQIRYRDEIIHGHRVDLVVENVVVVELKADERLDAIHRAQLVSYLRAMRLRAGLLMNFNTDHLKGSVRRVVV
jgi:GxxExxY protein